MEKDIMLSIFTLRTCFYLNNLNREEQFQEFDSFLEKFENQQKSDQDILELSKFSFFRFKLKKKGEIKLKKIILLKKCYKKEKNNKF